jgi:serine/threonine protein kinase
LFDFGISKELHSDQRLPDGTFQLTKMTGSIVYMAPEIGLGQTYNESADVYSMSILIYEILALRAAFPATFNVKAYKEQVHVGQKRPPLENVGLSTSVKEMLTKGWHQDLHERPTMGELSQFLEDEYALVHGDKEFLDMSRRSSGSEFFKAKG